MPLQSSMESIGSLDNLENVGICANDSVRFISNAKLGLGALFVRQRYTEFSPIELFFVENEGHLAFAKVSSSIFVLANPSCQTTSL